MVGEKRTDFGWEFLMLRMLRKLLKPHARFLRVNIQCVECILRLEQVDDALNNAHQNREHKCGTKCEDAPHNTYCQIDKAGAVKTQVEFVNAQPAKKDCEKPCSNVVLHCAKTDVVHRAVQM